MKNALIILFASIFITSCNVGGMWKDENIDPKIKAKIHQLNYELIDGFVENDPEKVFAICSEDLVKKSKNEFVNLIYQVRQSFSREDFKILNEFYQKNASENAQTNVMTGISGDHDYVLTFQKRK